MKKILVLNSGSSSIKFALFLMPSKELVLTGNCQAIGFDNCDLSINLKGEKSKYDLPGYSLTKVCDFILSKLVSLNAIKDISEIDAIGHRIVHGASFFDKSVIINEKVEQQIQELFEYAPLHNPANYKVYEIFKNLVKKPHVAVFDTAFHQSISEENYLFPIPYKYFEKNNLRRYGFHGTNYKFLTKELEILLNKKHVNFIGCHIGAGCSVTAIKDSKSFATTMGFGPLGGVMMGTRSGDIDPTVLAKIAEIENVNIPQVMKILNNESGIKGVSENVSGDYRLLLEKVKAGDKKAIVAQKLFSRRLIDFVAQYYFLLDANIDAIVLSAGIAENSAPFKKDFLSKLEKPLNLKIDWQKIESNASGLVSTNDSHIKIFVIPANEELMICEEVFALTN